MEWVGFVFGMVIGSFLNVCIYRLPASQSIVHPRSCCPQCGHLIRAYDNIPVVSYVLLRGRCRDCGAKISIRYPLVELLSGTFAMMVSAKYGVWPEGVAYFGLIAALIIIIFIDIDHQIIPDEISIPGIHIGFILSFFLPSMSPHESLLGYLFGGGLLFLIAVVYQKIRNEEGMGGGDVKLLAMIGAFIGWKGVFFTIFVASMAGTLAAIIQKLCTIMFLKKAEPADQSLSFLKMRIPFGPFLAIGAISYLFFGHQLIHWYLKTVR